MNRIQKWMFNKAFGKDGLNTFDQKSFTDVSNNQYIEAVYAFLNQNFTHKSYEDKLVIEEAYQFNSDFYAITNYLITCFSALDFKLMQTVGGEEVEIKNDPILDLLYRPNPTEGKGLFLEKVLLYKYLTGNSYVYGIGPSSGMRGGKPTELWVLPAERVNIISGGPMMPIESFTIEAQKTQNIPADQVMHWKYCNPNYNESYGLYGMSPAKAAFRVIQKSNDGLTAEIAMFENGGPAKIIAKNPGQYADFSQEQAQQLEKSNRLKYGGAHNKNKWAFTGASVEVHDLGDSPADLQLSEAQMVAFRQMCRIFKFPPELLGDPAAKTYNNVSEAKKGLYTDNLIPEFKSLLDELNRWLIPMFGDSSKYLVCDTSSIEVLQKDKKDMVEWLANAWWIKGIDKQRMMGIEEDEALNGYFSNGMLMPIGDKPDPKEVNELEKFLKDNGISDYV
jgi:HK97 family phage portal protein